MAEWVVRQSMTSITPYEFFFDAQQKRFLEQIVRAFSGFSYQTGSINGQPPQTVLVPCTLALTNRQVGSIINQNSENTLQVIPHIVVYQTGLRGRKEDLQNRAFIDHQQVFERSIVNGRYTGQRGNAYTVDRLMPLPFNMDVQVDVWTSNLEQKHQLVEQILIAMYPDFQIQNSDNALDWTANTICIIDDDLTWSSRNIPSGTADDIDYFSLKLRLPIYLSPPAKIKRISRIEEIIANVGDLVVDPVNGPEIGELFTRVIVTPGDHFIRVEGNVITLLADKAADLMPDGSLPSWSKLFELYGIFESGVSELRLLLTSDPNGPFVAGTITYSSNINEVIWTVDQDTLPANSLAPIDAVINPQTAVPGSNIPPPINGARYLLVEDIGASSVAWGSLNAHANDIIQYSSMAGQWLVSFNSSINIVQQYVLNLHTGRQLRWNGGSWEVSILFEYEPGYWRVAL